MKELLCFALFLFGYFLGYGTKRKEYRETIDLLKEKHAADIETLKNIYRLRKYN